MPTDPPSPPLSAAWAEAVPPGRGLRRLARLAGLLAVLLLAAWAVPPLLDWGHFWGRFRTDIAAIAASRLGRPVSIGGEVRLRLLPQAVLTASDVTIQDQGDGISVQVAALRLQVATWPLLTGRLVLRDLVLSAPVLRLPWALPDGLAHPSRPSVPHAFAARIENGTLRVGDTEITSINAAVHGGPEPAAPGAAGAPLLADAPPGAAFAAEGFTTAAGRAWRFTSALGAPDADGVSAVDISMHGQGAAGSTGATLQATLADGVVQGRVRASGPDLSLLIPALLIPASPVPASAMAWQAEAPFVASADHIEANAISLVLGGAPAEAALNLSLAAPARLDGTIHAAAIDLDGWAALFGRGFGAHAPASGLLPLRIRLAAETARLLGGTLRDLGASLASDGKQLGLDQVAAILPGEAKLTAAHIRLDHASGPGSSLAWFGPMRLAAPDLRTTLAWLRPLAPAAIDSLPPGVLTRASLSGAATLAAGGLTLTGLSGQIDGAAASGSLAVARGPLPALHAHLALDSLALDPWLAGPMTGPLNVTTLPALAAHFTASETTLQVAAKSASFAGHLLTSFTLDAAMGARGLRVARGAAQLDGMSLAVSGGLLPGGRIDKLRATAGIADLAATARLLPQGWIRAPGLWHGPATVALDEDGPPETLALQLRADAQDLNLEVEATTDSRTQTTQATVTARHPGAPRLLAALGFPGGRDAAIAWLGTGSLAARAALRLRPGHLSLADFDLTAASLRAAGTLEADWSGRVPVLTGRIEAASLPLPPTLPQPDWAALVSGWEARLHLKAASLTRLGHTLLSDVAADVAAAGGIVQASKATAILAGGAATFEATANLATPAYTLHGAVTGAALGAPLAGWPIDLDAGQLDLDADLSMGAALSSLSGSLHAALRDARATGLDLAALSAAAPARSRAGRAAVQAALRGGESPGLAGSLDAGIAQGRLRLAPFRLVSAEGSIGVAGVASLSGGPVDVLLSVTTAGPGAPNYALRLVGDGQGVLVQAARRGKR